MARSLPHHREAEQSVLGIIFLDPRQIVVVQDLLDTSDFFERAHMLIYDAMRGLSASNLRIDYTSVAARLEESGSLQQAGGIQYIYQLAEAVPSTDHIDTYIDLVRGASLKRQVMEVAGHILEDGYTGNTDPDNYLAQAEESVFALAQKRRTTEFVKLSDVVREVRDKTERNRDNKGDVTGLRTGFSNLDQITNGLQAQELLILAARPSMGKSAFALNLALNVAKRNADGQASVAIFSLEMSNEQLAGRMLSAESNVRNVRIKTGGLTGREWQFLDAGMQSLARLNIVFDDSAAVTVSDIRAKCRKLAHENRLDFVVIDYLQLIKGDARAGNRQEEVARISRSLKQMARELDVPVLALSQLSRDVEKRDDKRPVLADLRESGSIEQDADIVMFLYRPDYYKREADADISDVELIIAKNRQGIAGVARHFRFDTEYSRFVAQEDRPEDDQTRD